MARVEDFFIMDNAVTGITDEDYRNIQDVVDKHDLVVACLLLDILQRVAHRHVLEVTGYALRVCYAC